MKKKTNHKLPRGFVNKGKSFDESPWPKTNFYGFANENFEPEGYVINKQLTSVRRPTAIADNIIYKETNSGSCKGRQSLGGTGATSSIRYSVLNNSVAVEDPNFGPKILNHTHEPATMGHSNMGTFRRKPKIAPKPVFPAN